MLLKAVCVTNASLAMHKNVIEKLQTENLLISQLHGTWFLEVAQHQLVYVLFINLFVK